MGINNRGQIIGQYSDEFVRWHGFLLDGEVFTTIDEPSFEQSLLSGINDRGEIVGQSFNEGLEGFHSFIATPIKKTRH